MTARLLIANRSGIASVTILLIATSLLGACGRGPAEPSNVTAAASQPRPKAEAPPVRPAAPDAVSCAPAPTLALAQDFSDPDAAFSAASAPFRRLQANFSAAYRIACERNLLRGRPLIAAGAAEADRLLIKNAPDANVASIYLEGEEGAPRAQRHMVLEFPFLTADGATHVPTESEIGEAIYCTVHGATQREEEESGRCLAD